jgi:mono/diheme cytochrome c family protein
MTTKTIPTALLVLISALVLAACDRAVTYEKQIAPLLKKQCAACHGEGAPALAEFDQDKDGWKKKGKGPRMDSYESLVVFVNGTDAGALMRRLDDGKNTKDGKPGNMYVNLGGTDAERAANLALIKRWVGDGSWILKKRPEWTEAEVRAVKAAR